MTKKTTDQHFEVDLTIPAMRMNQFHDQLLCLDQCGRTCQCSGPRDTQTAGAEDGDSSDLPDSDDEKPSGGLKLAKKRGTNDQQLPLLKVQHSLLDHCEDLDPGARQLVLQLQ